MEQSLGAVPLHQSSRVLLKLEDVVVIAASAARRRGGGANGDELHASPSFAQLSPT